MVSFCVRSEELRSKYSKRISKTKAADPPSTRVPLNRSTGRPNENQGELNNVRTVQTNHISRGIGTPISRRHTTTTRCSDQLEHRSDTGGSDNSVQPRNQTTHLGHVAMGPGPKLGQRCENRIQDHQRPSRDGRYGTVLQASV